MCRDKENKMTDIVFGEKESDRSDEGDVCQKPESITAETRSVFKIKNCSDEQSCEDPEEKLLRNIAISDDCENAKENEEYSAITDPSEPNCQQDDEKIALPEKILPAPLYAFFNGISVFCFSQQGESHKKNSIPCQDRSGFKVIDDKIVIAAIADGVGSCALSDYGAEVAVNSGIAFLEQYFVSELKQDSFEFDDPSKMGKALRNMMRYALENVEKRAAELNQIPYSFQSTLTVAAYDGNTLYFAHAGDDGIVALNKTGTYALVTSRHKGDEASSVYPLQSQNTWQFGKVDDTVAFIMATDGVLDAFVRPLPEDNRVYYPFIEPVFYNRQMNAADAKQACHDWYDYMASPSYRASVTDDLSFVGVVNQKAIATSVKPVFEIDKWEQQAREYQEKRKAALYFSKTETRSDSESGKQTTENIKGNEEGTVKRKGTAGTRETGNIPISPTGMQNNSKSNQEKNIKRMQGDRVLLDPSDSAKQARQAAKKVNDGMREFATVSFSFIFKGIGRATSYIGETIEQVSEEMKKKNSQGKCSEPNNSDERR